MTPSLHHGVVVVRLDVVVEVVSQLQRLEVLLGAADLRLLGRAVLAALLALRLHEEVHALLAVIPLFDVGPVGVVASERRVYLEPFGSLANTFTCSERSSSTPQS